MIYVGFSYPKRFKIGAWLIAKWMGKPYSHVYLKFVSPSITNTIYQASHGMVHFTSEARFLEDNTSIKEIAIPAKDTTRLLALRHAISLAGEAYGYIELAKIFAYDIIFNVTGKAQGFQNSKGFVCSELAGKLLTDLYGITWHKPTHLLRPDDIEKGLTNGADAIYQGKKS